MESLYEQDKRWLLDRRPDLVGNEYALESFTERVAICMADGGMTEVQARETALKGVP